MAMEPGQETGLAAGHLLQHVRPYLIGQEVELQGRLAHRRQQDLQPQLVPRLQPGLQLRHQLALALVPGAAEVEVVLWVEGIVEAVEVVPWVVVEAEVVEGVNGLIG